MIQNLIKGTLRDQGGRPIPSSLKKYLKPQNPHTKTKVDGKWVTFTPNRDYYAESPDEINAYRMLASGRGQALATTNPALYAKALQLAAQGGPKLHKKNPQFSQQDTDFRGPVSPSSSALHTMKYNVNTGLLRFAFRQKNGGRSKFYTMVADGNSLYRWLSSPSLGKYFNRNLRNKVWTPKWFRK